MKEIEIPYNGFNEVIGTITEMKSKKSSGVNVNYANFKLWKIKHSWSYRFSHRRLRGTLYERIMWSLEFEIASIDSWQGDIQKLSWMFYKLIILTQFILWIMMFYWQLSMISGSHGDHHFTSFLASYLKDSNQFIYFTDVNAECRVLFSFWFLLTDYHRVSNAVSIFVCWWFKNV